MTCRAPLAVVAVLLVASPAAADGPVATARATAQLTVTFRAFAESSFYRWDFGDGTTAEGAVVEHVYAQPGRYRATVTTDAGETTVEAVAYRVTFGVPTRARYGSRARFTGSIWPAVRRAHVEVLGPGGRIARTQTRANGGFVVRGRVRSTGPFRARVAGLASEQVTLLLRPRIDARLVGSRIVGEPLRLTARVQPAAAGTVTAVVWRDGRRASAGPVGSGVRLRTRRPASFRIRLEVAPADGYLPAVRKLTAAVVRPVLVYGSRGPAVRALQQRLRELHYALPGADGVFSLATYQAVLAFQAVAELPRTGGVNAGTWRRLMKAEIPQARYPGSHIEISKGRQVLYAVRGGRVQLVVHVSTGATGNTPLGHWHIYRKVVGWDWVLWYPMYFLRGFAVHGYPEVPSYPASHGCVRVPMWVAPTLFRGFFVGESVYIYW
ncbi:MAG TPA: PKD domain-containing protein [Gaiellaceae bacterium]